MSQTYLPVKLSRHGLLLPAHFRCEAAISRWHDANMMMIQHYTVGGSSLEFSSHLTPQFYIYGWFICMYVVRIWTESCFVISQTRCDIFQIYYNVNTSENLDTHLCLVSSYSDARWHVTSATISSVGTKPGATKPLLATKAFGAVETALQHWWQSQLFIVSYIYYTFIPLLFLLMFLCHVLHLSLKPQHSRCIAGSAVLLIHNW